MKKLLMKGPMQSEVVEAEMPKIQHPKQLIVKNRYCGVCMSEHYYWTTAKEGQTFGHEPMGVIAEIGSGVTKFKVGDRVSGLYSGNSEYALSDEDHVFLIPDNIPDEAAVLEPLSCLISAVSKVKIPMVGERVAVVGCGSVSYTHLDVYKRQLQERFHSLQLR